MKISIVDTDKTPFWAIPEADIYLNGENNEVEFDPSKLTPFQQQTVWASLKMKIITSDDADDFNKDFVKMLTGYLEKRQKNQVTQMRQVFGVDLNAGKEAIDNVQKVNELKTVMKGSISTLRKILPDYTAADLELAYKIETLNKNRKGVLKLISDLIRNQTKASVSKVEHPNAPSAKEFEKRQVLRGENKALLSNLSGVRESDKEEVVIKV